MLPQKYYLLSMLLFTTNTFGSTIDKDVVAGEKIYTQCAACHSPDYHRTGPKHCGIFGKQAGSDPEFTYTSAMQNSGIIWSEISLNAFLKSPLQLIPGTSMGFSGISSAIKRRQLIAYLKSLKPGSSRCQ